MLLYLDHAWEKFKAQGSMNRIEDLYAAVIEGAAQRIRPKIMTLCAIIFGLLPIMWSPVYQAGAHVMKRIATPMIGGVITSAILNLLIYPVIYVIWRKRSLLRGRLTDPVLWSFCARELRSQAPTSHGPQEIFRSADPKMPVRT